MVHTKEVLDLTKGVIDLAGAFGSLLLKLGKLLRDEYRLPTNVKEDVKDLVVELQSMHSALRKVRGVPRDQLDEQVKLWADEVRDMSYHMENVVDKFLVRIEGSEPAELRNAFVRFMKKMGELFTKGKTHHEISDEIKRIKARIQETADRRDRYRVNMEVANLAGATKVDPRLLALYKDRKELVGIDWAMSELTKWLTNGDDDDDVSKQLRILSFWGCGGVGKTSIAKAAYDKLQEQFDCHAFVPVGRNPSIKELLNDILYEIDKQKYPELDERQLIDKLRGLLENKRYFIVIDDIWDIETWQIVRCALVDNNCASRIITTTRNLEVAETTGGEIYSINPLSHDLSKELFHTRLFGGKNKCPYDQQAMVNNFLQKCGGVPLAIITMASILIGKPETVWPKIYNSIGFGDEYNKDVETTRKILLFSYYDLPCHLRTCLLYMSQYQEDQLILKDSLIWRWVAEGFVQEEDGIGLFETGERYFNELVNKSLIQPKEIRYGIIHSCGVHDMVFDMIGLLAKEENFITMLDSHEQHTYQVHGNNVHRLFTGHKTRLVDTPMPQVRTFSSLSFYECRPSLSCFEFLRVLALLGGDCHLEHVGKLVHLRYLGLAYMYIHELPKEIGDLKFLQTLDFSNVKFGLEELPRSVGQLSRLKCLLVEETNARVADWIGNLTSLEMLCLNSVDHSFVYELGKLIELRELRIRGTVNLCSVSRARAWRDSLVKLQKIQVIDITGMKPVGFEIIRTCWEGYALSPHLRNLHLPYTQLGLVARIKPSLLPSLTNLKVVVHTTDLEIFGRFPNLVSLYLMALHGLHHDATGAPGGFPKLRIFRTSGTLRPFVEGDMPSLEILRFSLDAVRVVDFDFGSLVNLPSLQEVMVDIWYAPGTDINDMVMQAAVMHDLDILIPSHLAYRACFIVVTGDEFQSE